MQMNRKLLVRRALLCLCLALLTCMHVRRNDPFVVRAGTAGSSRLNLKYDRGFHPAYVGRDGQPRAFSPGANVPLSIASADFNADGAPDLVQGYAAGNAGVLTLYRGNPEAFTPARSETIQGIAHGAYLHPYLARAVVYDLPETPDFLIAGDFDQDGYLDVLVAARGSQKAYLLSGDGSGAFADPREIDLPGSLTALAAAHFHSGDIGFDVIAGVNGPNGPALLYYEAAYGGLGASPLSLSLPFAPTMLKTGLLDDDPYLDVAIAGNGQLMILHGAQQPWGVQDAAAVQSRLESPVLPALVGALALGDFITDQANRIELAVLSMDGATLSILSRGTLNQQPFTQAQLQTQRAAAFSQPLPGAAVAAWQPGATAPWQVAQTRALSSPVNMSNPANVLTAARFTDDPGEQLLVLDSAAQRINLYAVSSTGEGLQQVLSVAAQTAPVAAIPARMSLQARPGLAILQQGDVASIVNTPTASVTVSTTGDVVDAPDLSSIAALIANPGPDGQISLREAVLASNNSGGSNVINLAAGTYTLTGASLAVQTGTTLLGAGSANTIIQGGATPGSGSDKIFAFNPIGSLKNGFGVSLTGVTLRYSQNGAFDFDAGPDFGGSLVLSDVVIDQNSTTARSGGGAAFYDGGEVTIFNSSITNNTANSDGNEAVVGGGLAFGSVPSAANGSISLTNVTISGNTAASHGGGLASLTIPLGLHSSTITNNRNQNSGYGGGIYGSLALDQATLVTNNTAAGPGGGVAGWGTIAGVTISNNAAALAGGGLFAMANASLIVTNSRIVGNTATNGASAADTMAGGAIQAINNWWGSNSTPTAMVASSGVAFDPWLQMTFTASPATIEPNRSSTLTASITTNSNNQTGFRVPKVANNTPAAFAFSGIDDASASPASATTFSGSATSTLTAGSTLGSGTATAAIDGQTLSVDVVVKKLTATKLAVSAPAVATPGLPFTVTVTAQDASNNTVTDYAGVVQFSSTDGSAVLPANSALINGVGTFSVTLQTPGAQTITASDLVTPSITGTSATITVSTGAATHFTVLSPNSATAGAPFSFYVTALDGANNVAIGYSGTIHFTSTDAKAVLPPDATLTKGVGTFTGTFKTAGSQTITATDTVNPSTTGTAFPTIVSANVPAQYAVAAPASTTTGASFNFTVTITDAYGNPASFYVGSLAFSSSDPNAVLPPSQPLVNGFGSFTAILKTPGVQTLTATDTKIPAITGTATITVNALPATHLGVSAPATVTAGTPFSLTVTALDVNNNATPNYSGTVHFTTTDAAGLLPVNSTLTNGLGTFSATLKTGGNQTITATDTLVPSITGTSNNINVLGGPATHIILSAPATATAGTPFNFTVTAKDALNNIAQGYAGVLHFTSTDGPAILPPNATLTNGVGTFPATLKTVGTQTITATDIANSAITATSGPITVTFGAAATFHRDGACQRNRRDALQLHRDCAGFKR